MFLNVAQGDTEGHVAFVSPTNKISANNNHNQYKFSIMSALHQPDTWVPNLTPSLLKMSSDEVQSSASLEKKELTPETVIEMIEVTFINACLQLAKGYVDVLKLFIVAVKTGYEMGLTIPELVEKLEDFPIQSANRPLMPEELKLRAAWMNIVYMVLENFNESGDFDIENSLVDTEIRQKYGDHTKFIADWRKQQNFDDRDAAAMVAELKVEDVLKGCSGATAMISDTMEKALLPQNLRVALLTLTVIEEEKRCLDDNMPPQPNIPGTN